jgi:predicted metalloprotease
LPIDTGPLLDLSKATKLKDIEFRCIVWIIRWTTTALQTIKSENLRQITISLYSPSALSIEEAGDWGWLDLDRLLTQFSTSYSIRPKLTQVERDDGVNLRDLALSLFPELSRRGVIDVVEL